MWPPPALTPARTSSKSLGVCPSRALHWSEKLQANVCACLVSCQVEYQCDGFVEKNRDAVPEELVGLLRASKVRATLSRGCVGQSLAGLWPCEPGAGKD